jgi:hypothetical protein
MIFDGCEYFSLLRQTFHLTKLAFLICEILFFVLKNILMNHNIYKEPDGFPKSSQIDFFPKSSPNDNSKLDLKKSVCNNFGSLYFLLGFLQRFK